MCVDYFFLMLFSYWHSISVKSMRLPKWVVSKIAQCVGRTSLQDYFNFGLGWVYLAECLCFKPSNSYGQFWICIWKCIFNVIQLSYMTFNIIMSTIIRCKRFHATTTKKCVQKSKNLDELQNITSYIDKRKLSIWYISI